MNSGHIKDALSIPLFKGHFMGFLFSDSLELTLSKKRHKNLDFYVINTDHVFGQHWFACIRGGREWIIFDCSTFTPRKDHELLKAVLSRELDVVFDCKQLQQPTSLTCGLHVISFIYFIFGYLKNHKEMSYDSNYYCNKLLDFCKKIHYSPDNFVYHSIYDSGLFPLELENQREIEAWLEHFR